MPALLGHRDGLTTEFAHIYFFIISFVRESQGNYRDALFLGDCDDGVRQLCEALGWEEELQDLQSSCGMRAMSLETPATSLPVPADLPHATSPRAMD